MIQCWQIVWWKLSNGTSWDSVWPKRTWTKTSSSRVLENNPAAKAGRHPVRKQRISIRLERVIDQQRFDGISNEAVEQVICYYFGESSYEVIKKERADGQICPDDGKTFTRIGDRSKQIIKEQGSIEEFEILELLNKVQCEHCHKHMSSGHVCCHCGRSFVYPYPKPDIFEADAA